MGRPISELSEKICDYMAVDKSKTASKIIVNNDLDYNFLNRQLIDYIEKKQVEIILLEEELATDRAFEIFVNKFQNMSNDDDYDA